jgi:hypothetical protein
MKYNDYTVTFTGLTADQAKTLASWYEGQGEQDADIWFDVNCEDGTPWSDKIEELPNGNIKVHCKSY